MSKEEAAKEFVAAVAVAEICEILFPWSEEDRALILAEVDRILKGGTPELPRIIEELEAPLQIESSEEKT